MQVTESAELLYYILTRGTSLAEESAGSDAFSASEVKDTDGDGLLEIVDAWGNPVRFYRWPTRLIRSGGPGTVLTVGSGSPARLLVGNLRPDYPEWANTAYALGAVIIAQDQDTTAANRTNRVYRCVVAGTSDTTAPDWTTAANQRVGARIVDGGVTWEVEIDPLAVDPDDPQGTTSAPSDPAAFEGNYHTPDTWHAPLIVSAGADGLLGLHEPYDSTDSGRLANPQTPGAPPNDRPIEDNISNQQLRAGGN
jgi:hypothetical protein